MIPNPEYKGKWRPEMIDNPEYKGEWKPAQIPNPDYFVDELPADLPEINGLAIEIWTMSRGLAFDNFLVTHEEEAAKEWAAAVRESGIGLLLRLRLD